MVLTRSQAAKNKANQSPEPSVPKVTKQPRKQRGGSGEAAEPDEEQPGASASLRSKLLSSGGMGLKASKLKASGPTSHPIASLPASPNGGSSPGRDFSIPAVQQDAALAEAAAVAVREPWDPGSPKGSPGGRVISAPRGGRPKNKRSMAPIGPILMLEQTKKGLTAETWSNTTVSNGGRRRHT